MTIDRKRDLGALAASLAAQGDTVADGLVERLATVLEDGEEMPDVRFLLQLLERLLERSAGELDRADSEGWRQAMELSTLRWQCRKAKAEVHTAAVATRRALVEIVGSKQCRFQFGLSPRTPRGAADLAIETRRLVDRLKAGPSLRTACSAVGLGRDAEPQARGLGALAAPGLRLEGSLLPGVEADPQRWVAGLEPGLGRLEELLQRVEVGRIAAEDGVIARNRALQASRETCRVVTDVARALFLLAGEKELARRLRPSPKRRRQRRPAAERSLIQRATSGARALAATLLEWLRTTLGRLRRAAAELGRPRRRKSAGFRPRPLAQGIAAAPKA